MKYTDIKEGIRVKATGTCWAHYIGTVGTIMRHYQNVFEVKFDNGQIGTWHESNCVMFDLYVPDDLS